MTPGNPTTAIIGKGTTLSWANVTTGSSSSSIGSYTALAEVLDIKMPKATADTIEIQRFDSPSLYGELIPSWFKGGEMDVTLTYNAAQGAALFALLGVIGAFKITKPDTNTWVYVGILTEFGDEIPLKDKMMNTVKFKVSGAPTPTGSSA